VLQLTFKGALYDDSIKSAAEAVLGPQIGPLTALQLACFYESEAAATELLKHLPLKAVDQTWGGGCTTLHLASFNGLLSVVTELLQRGARANAVNAAGFNPLDCALDQETRDCFFRAPKPLPLVRTASRSSAGSMDSPTTPTLESPSELLLSPTARSAPTAASAAASLSVAPAAGATADEAAATETNGMAPTGSSEKVSPPAPMEQRSGSSSSLHLWAPPADPKTMDIGRMSPRRKPEPAAPATPVEVGPHPLRRFQTSVDDAAAAATPRPTPITTDVKRVYVARAGGACCFWSGSLTACRRSSAHHPWSLYAQGDRDHDAATQDPTSTAAATADQVGHAHQQVSRAAAAHAVSNWIACQTVS